MKIITRLVLIKICIKIILCIELRINALLKQEKVHQKLILMVVIMKSLHITKI